MLTNLRDKAAQALLGFLLVFLSAVVAFASGWLYGRSQLATTQALATTEAALAVEKTASADLATAIKLSDTLFKELDLAEREIRTLSKEKTLAITQLTTGQACLNARTVNALNRVPERPANAGLTPLPDAFGGTHAADGEVATDSDVAHWINFAIGQYDTCRARLDALIDFEEAR